MCIWRTAPPHHVTTTVGEWFPYNAKRFEDSGLLLGVYDRDAGSSSRYCCNKFYSKHGVGTPGTLFGLCLDCNGFVGMKFLKFAESERTIFELLLTRWPTPPKVVVYDNACNAHYFCLSREPDYFKFTQFIIDQLHASGHKACSCAYDPTRHEIVINKNTQQCEQLNSKFTRKQSQLYKMGQVTALWHLRLFALLTVMEKTGLSF